MREGVGGGRIGGKGKHWDGCEGKKSVDKNEKRRGKGGETQ